jgi:alanine racemase
MDMLAVDLRALPTAKVGDQVIAWGAELPVEIIAQHAATIPFDLVTRLQNRITCRWIE